MALEDDLLGLVPVAILHGALEVGTVVSVEVGENAVLVFQTARAVDGGCVLHGGHGAGGIGAARGRGGGRAQRALGRGGQHRGARYGRRSPIDLRRCRLDEVGVGRVEMREGCAGRE